jgi:chloramphenicol-sensitive protein RarD
MQAHPSPSSLGRGISFALLAYLSWGLLPLYWKLLSAMPHYELVAHRMLWSGAFMLLLLLCLKRGRTFSLLWVQRPHYPKLLLSAVIITLNWGAFIYTVNSGRVLQASLGYFISPLVMVFLGVVFLKEKLTFWQKVSVSIALAGVINLTLHAEEFPIFALVLAGTFGAYSIVRKGIPVDPLVASTIENLLQVIPGGILALYLAQPLATLEPNTYSFLLPLSGVMTALPLLWYASAVRYLKLSLVGFFQYIAPTVKFILAVFVFAEPISTIQISSFSCVWIALAIYSWDAWRRMKKSRFSK